MFFDIFRMSLKSVWYLSSFSPSFMGKQSRSSTSGRVPWRENLWSYVVSGDLHYLPLPEFQKFIPSTIPRSFAAWLPSFHGMLVGRLVSYLLFLFGYFLWTHVAWIPIVLWFLSGFQKTMFVFMGVQHLFRFLRSRRWCWWSVGLMAFQACLSDFGDSRYIALICCLVLEWGYVYFLRSHHWGSSIFKSSHWECFYVHCCGLLCADGRWVT